MVGRSVGGQFGPLLFILFLLVGWSPMERKKKTRKDLKKIEKYVVGHSVGGRRSLVKEGGKPRDEERRKAGRGKKGWKKRRRAMKDLTHRYVISQNF